MTRKRRRSHAAPAPATREPNRSSPRSGHVLGISVLIALLILGVLGDDRHVGLVADGRQMIRTAVALVETGGIAQAAGRDFTIETPSGDWVSRFGMATSLLQIPAAWLAPRIELRQGAGSSQALFLLVPWLALGVAAACAGRLARALGGTNFQVAASVLLASVASPLGSYATLEFSETVQAACLVAGLWAALAAARSPSSSTGLVGFAGFTCGLAVLTKSSLLAAAPFTLLPLIDPTNRARSLRALVRAGAAASGPLAIWAFFEYRRFGALFGGYPDDRFTHFWLDGFVRLLGGPNQGLLWFWPPLVLFGMFGLMRGRSLPGTPEGRAWIGATLVLASELSVAAGYWGWHGMEGWGPRLIVSAIPLLAPFAALALDSRRRALPALLVALSILMNAPPLLQHPTPVATYVMNLPWPEIEPQDASRFPFYARSVSPSGRPTVVPFEATEVESAVNPWRLFWWFHQVTQLDGPPLSEALASPPWIHTRPDLVPGAPWPPPVARQIAPPPRFGFLGRSLTGEGGPYATVYLDALLDQVVRAHQEGSIERALALSDLRLRLRDDGEAAAWRLESLRRIGDGPGAEALLRSLPESSRTEPLVNVVLALFDREGGEEGRARALLRSVAGAFPTAPLQKALETPLSDWPDTLDAMTRSPRRDAAVAGAP